MAWGACRGFRSPGVWRSDPRDRLHARHGYPIFASREVKSHLPATTHCVTLVQAVLRSRARATVPRFDKPPLQPTVVMHRIALAALLVLSLGCARRFRLHVAGCRAHIRYRHRERSRDRWQLVQRGSWRDVGISGGDRVSVVTTRGALPAHVRVSVSMRRASVVAPGFIDIQSARPSAFLRGDSRVVGKVTQASPPKCSAKEARPPHSARHAGSAHSPHSIRNDTETAANTPWLHPHGFAGDVSRDRTTRCECECRCV
jgi:hypothetical protein